MIKRKKLGQFFTKRNPFKLKHFKKWFESALKESNQVLEPFAGSNNLIKMLKVNYQFKSFSYDIEPADQAVIKKDTIKSFPTKFKIAITNPPWLAKNSAKRKGIKIDHSWKKFDNLYKICLQKMLDNCDYVGAILPASFIKTKNKLFLQRLVSYTVLNWRVFDETENPSCLALFSKDKQEEDFEIFKGSKKIGRYKEITNKIDELVPSKKNKTIIKFNSKRGNLGIITIDKVKKKNIKFVPSEEIPDEKIKKSSRHLVKIWVESNKKIEQSLIQMLNDKIMKIRNEINGEVLLTPFKGLMYNKNNRDYRRRMDFKLIRRIIESTI